MQFPLWSSVQQLSLLDTAVITGVALVPVATAVAVVHFSARSPRRRLVLATVMVGGGGVAVLAVRAWAGHEGFDTSTAPTVVWIAIAAAVATTLGAVLGWMRMRWAMRGVAVIGVAVGITASLLGANTWIGYYPTVGALVDAAVDREPVPIDGVTTIRAMRLHHQIPERGHTLVLPRSPSDGFRARPEYVWLPPAWFDHRTTRFDVVVLIPGVINTPRDWIVSGGAVDSAQDWARRHSGHAPILVFADPSGGLSNDTECVDGPRGRAETHLTTELVRRLDTALADDRPRDLVVAGWSMGGTCAMTLAARHPRLFPRFVSISGDPRPNVAGGPSATTRELFAGRRDALAQHSVVTLAGAMRPGTISGFLAASYRRGSDPARSREVQTVQTVSSVLGRTGQVTTTVVEPGGHDWAFARRQLRAALHWLSRTPPPAPAPR